MKNLKIIALICLIFITGCKATIEDNIADDNYPVKEEEQAPSNEEVETPEPPTTIVSEEPTEKKDTETSKEETVNQLDNQAINYFNELNTNVNIIIQSDETSTVKDSLKSVFITIVDFVFYDSEINGIRFNDLSEGAKQNILETAALIDSKIMTKYPNYKDEIADTATSAYNKASELIKKGATNIKNFSKEKLGEENYNAIIEAKDKLVNSTKDAFDKLGDVASDILDSGKDKLKDWYENFKNN